MVRTADTLTLGRLNRATLARQLLLARRPVSVVEAVERLGGMQAQEAKPPFLGLWARVEGFRREDLVEALHERRVVRALLMRGTLHLMSAADFAAVREALAPVMTAALNARTAIVKGLDLDTVLPAARRLLSEEPRAFKELRALLAEEFPQASDRGLGYAARTQLPLVMVPTGDRWAFPAASKFALAERWLDEPLSRDGEPEALVLRHLAAFGPATAADVQTWSGLRALKPVLEELRPQLRAFADERGRELFDLPGAPRPDEDVPAPARFLPEFDNLVLAHADRSRLLADEHRGRATTKNLRVRATFLWDGMVRGTWTTERKKDTATLVISPFEKLPRRAVEELGAEGEALLRFVEEDAGTFDVRVADADADGDTGTAT